MSGRWFTVPTRDEVNQRKLENRNAKRAAARGEDLDDEPVVDSRRERQVEKERQAAAKEHERQIAAEKQREAKAAREAAIVAAKAAAVKRAEAQERFRRSKDPSCWPDMIEALKAAQTTVAKELDALLDDETNAMLDGNPGLRFEYVMAVVEQATAQTKMPAGHSTARLSMEPADSVVRAFSGSNSALMVALERHFDYESPTAVELLEASTALFGARGNTVPRVAQGEQLGARMVLQMLLRRYADAVANDLDTFTTFFFNGAAGDKSSAAFVNLGFVLDQITASASNAALRNAVVSVTNNADRLGLSAALLGLMGKWFTDAAQHVATDCDSQDVKPLLLTAAAAELLLAAVPDTNVAASLIVNCGVLWHPGSGASVFGPLLKRVKAPEDVACTAVCAVIAAAPQLSTQLAASAGSSTQQVSCVLQRLQKLNIALPRDVAAAISASAAEVRAKGATGAKADALASLSRAAGAVKTTTTSSAHTTLKGKGTAGPAASATNKAPRLRAKRGGGTIAWLLVPVLLVGAAFVFRTEITQRLPPVARARVVEWERRAHDWLARR